MKENKGITLVALVITIIIMLILAGVVISFAFGESGIIKIAKLARNNYINVQEQENILLGEYEAKINEYTGKELVDYKKKVGKVLYKSETKTFGATTVNIDGSNFNLFQIVLKNVQYGGHISVLIKKGESQNVGFTFKHTDGNYYTRYRNIKISSDGTQVIFGNTYQVMGSAVSAPINNELIPIYVIGYSEEDIADIFD